MTVDRLRPLKEICFRCFSESVSDRELIYSIDDYVNSLDDTVRCDDSEYARRLALCGDCAERAGINCRQCGCFIQARCAKRAVSCPIGRWAPAPSGQL